MLVKGQRLWYLSVGQTFDPWGWAVPEHVSSQCGLHAGVGELRCQVDLQESLLVGGESGVAIVPAIGPQAVV